MREVIAHPIFSGDDSKPFGLKGQPTVSVDVLGTISAGHYTPQVSNNGSTWSDITMLNPAGLVITTITTAGPYRADVNGWALFQLAPSNDFAGATTVEMWGYPTQLLQSSSGVPMSELADEWAAGTYAANSIVTYNGSFWVANTSTSGVPGVAGWTEYETIADILTFILNELA